MTRSRRQRSGGFTLLEVLAAVAILGIWYVILAGVAIQGLRAQGESQRRLEASFIADDAISEIEAGLSSGNAPDENVEEYEREDYLVRIEVKPYTLDLPPPAGGSTSSQGDGAPTTELGTTNLLGGSDSSGGSPLRSIHVEVIWPEGNDERSVVRDTFGFDLESVRDELAALDGGGLEALGTDPDGQSGTGSVGDPDTSDERGTGAGATLPEAGL